MHPLPGKNYNKTAVIQLIPKKPTSFARFLLFHSLTPPSSAVFQSFLKVNKPKEKGKKTDPVEKEHVSDLIQRLSSMSFSLEEEAYQTLFTIFAVCFVSESILRDVIYPETIRLAGDGTPVVTSHRLRSYRVCDCAKKGMDTCSCDRYFSQPDCDIGWDSSR